MMAVFVYITATTIFLFCLHTMSAKSTAKKSVFISEPIELLYDVVPAQLPEIFPNVLPWPEWNDADINSETWVDTRLTKGAALMSKAAKSDANLESLTYFFDPEPHAFPGELEKFVKEWKRPHDLFPQETLAIYVEGSDYSSKAPSEHTANFELFNYFSDMCCTLQHHASMEPFPIESETVHYAANTKGQPWQPWHHIYGNCKAGKDVPHKPVYNHSGKYILRFYYFGAWRKFVVDDLIPCDEDGQCMLPLTKNLGELWPVLLMKGILKIAGQTRTIRVKMMDLPLWTLFTGWLVGALPVHQKSSEQVWRLLDVLTPEFTWPDTADFKSDLMQSSTRVLTKKERKESKSDEVRPILTVAELKNFPKEFNLEEETYNIPVIMTRDVPLYKSKLRKPTEPWKRIRWVDWAEKKGLWTDEKLIPVYRSLFVINFTKELYDRLMIDVEMEKRLYVPDEDGDADVANSNGDSPTQWIDYHKFYKYVHAFKFLLKPSTILSKYRLSYLDFGSGSSTSMKMRTSNVREDWQYYYLLPNVKVSSNEPAILYCESANGIFIFLSVWSYSVNSYAEREYENEFLKDQKASVLLERFDWRTAQQNKIYALVETVGYGSTYFFLNPGRHALRIWLDTDCPYVVEIGSDAEITIGKGTDVRNLMAIESVGIKSYLDRVSNSFIELVQKFGDPQLAKHIIDFVQIIKPKNSIVRNYLVKLNFFIKAFSVSIVTVLKSIIPNEEDLHFMVLALRSLFINPAIPIPKLKTVSTLKKTKKTEAPTLNSIDNPVSIEMLTAGWGSEEIKKVVHIQRTWRGYYVRLLLSYRDPQNKNHKIIAEYLKKICDAMFAPNKRDVEVARLIRETIASNPDLLETFLFHRDISNVTVTEEFTGKIVNVEPRVWVPMVRFIFVCHSQDALPCAFYLSCNLDQHVLTVTNNDTHEEIFRLANVTCPHSYEKNQNGYTLFAYGWNESETKTVSWRLEMLKMKYFLEIHPCNPLLVDITGNQCNPYQPQPLTMQEVKNFYVPNRHNKICTCLIKVRRKVMVSIRFSVSDENVKFHTRILKRTSLDSDNEDSEPVLECDGNNSGLIFNAVMLQPKSGTEENEQTFYAIESFVTDNSWPLTKHEWGMVEPLRVNGESWPENSSTGGIASRKSSTSSRRRQSRIKMGISQTRTVESPYWCVQVVADSDLSNVLELVEDKSNQEMIKAMKTSWEENDPGRRLRGRVYQRDFLRTIFEEMKMSRTEVEIVSSGSADAKLLVEDTTFNYSFDTLLHEMRSFSYLVGDKSEERYLKSPRILPRTPLISLLSQYSRKSYDTEHFSSSDGSKTLEGEDYIIPEIPLLSQELLQRERNIMLNKFKSQRIIMEDHSRRENTLSMTLMEQAYEERRKVIEKLKALSNKTEIKSEDGRFFKLNK